MAQRRRRSSTAMKASQRAIDDCKSPEKNDGTSIAERTTFENDVTSPRTPENPIVNTPDKLYIDSDSDTCIQDKVQTTLEKHGVDRQNAHNFFRGLVNDDDFKKLFMASLNSNNEEQSFDDESNVPMTRSKLKEYIQNSPHKVHWVNKAVVSNETLPKFADIPLSDDDDEDEYKPVTAEDSFECDSHATSTVSTTKNDMCRGTIDLTTSQFCLPGNSCNDHIISNDKPDVISKRTRSKHSLESTSLDVLQAAFNPPDVSDDMHDANLPNINDYDWQKWLSDLMKDDLSTCNIDEDNVDEDPDFNVIAELDKSECEEGNENLSLEIPTNEILGLLNELENINNLPPVSSTPVSKPTSSFLSPTKRRARRQRKKAGTRISKDSGVTKSGNAVLQVSASQLNLIEQQMQQHVQLLLQTNILCRNTDFEEYATESAELLYELRDMSASQVNILSLQRSYLTSCNLSSALYLVNSTVPPSPPVIRLQRTERMKHYVPLPLAVAKILAGTNACMYCELLPVSAPIARDRTQKMPSFLPAEDCLLAHGIAEMKGISRKYHELISHCMMPVRTDKQLSARYRNVVYCRNSKDNTNPIMKYHVYGTLPLPSRSVRHVHPEDAKRPIDMDGDLPCWVLALKPMYSTRSAVREVDDCNISTYSQSVTVSSPSSPEVMPSKLAVSSGCNATTSTDNHSPVSDPLYHQTNQSSVFQAYPSIGQENIVLGMKSDANKSDRVATDSSKMTVTTGASLATSTSQCLGMVTTPKVQRSVQFGRRKSAGKSIKCMRKVLATSSSSSDSEDDSKPSLKSEGPDRARQKLPRTTQDSEGDDAEISCSNAKRSPISTKSSIAPPVGGFLQKAHPKVMGKKNKLGNRDISKIRSSAKQLKTLEGDLNVISDPRHDEKERIFATGYLSRVKQVLDDQPEKYRKFLSILEKFTDSNLATVQVFNEITTILKDWPDLIQSFVPFLSFAQAQECGLAKEKRNYVRARRFFCQLEIQFKNDQDHLDKILDAFHSFSNSAKYDEADILDPILNLLKSHPYLQDEFVTFFDSQPPPKILFDEDFEEVDLTEDAMKEANATQFEHAVLPTELPGSDSTPINASAKKSKRRRISQGFLDDHQIPSSIPETSDNKENIYPEVSTNDDGIVTFDSESDDAMTEDEMNHETSAVIPPPNLAVINEDAQSSSPFKRITGEASLRPRTPTGIAENTSDTVVLSASMFPPYLSSSASVPTVPATPGKLPQFSGNLFQKSADDSSGKKIDLTTTVSPGTGKSEKDSHVPLSDNPLLYEKQPEPAESFHSGDVPDIIVIEDTSQQRGDVNMLPETIPVDTDQSLLKDKSVHAVDHDASNEPILPHEEDSMQSDSEVTKQPGADLNKPWTRYEDELLLTSCQQGISDQKLSSIAQELKRNIQDVEVRLQSLLDLFNMSESGEGSHESEEDGEICSDSSTA